MTDVMVTKGGIERFQFQVRRGNRGLLIKSKIHPDVEEFIRSLGSGDALPATRFSRDWRGIGDAALQAYDLSHNLGTLSFGNSQYYCLDRVGAPPWEQRAVIVGGRSVNAEVVNLSFLRLRGSAEQGVDFSIGGVYTNEQAAKYAQDIQMAARAFYMSYLKPINIIVTLSTQEIK